MCWISLLATVRVPMHEHADAARQRAGHGDFVAAQQRHVEPAELPRGKAGNSASRSGVVVKIALATSCLSMPLRRTISASSCRVAVRISSRSLCSTVVAPRTPRHAMTNVRPANDEKLEKPVKPVPAPLLKDAFCRSRISSR